MFTKIIRPKNNRKINLRIFLIMIIKRDEIKREKTNEINNMKDKCTLKKIKILDKIIINA